MTFESSDSAGPEECELTCGLVVALASGASAWLSVSPVRRSLGYDLRKVVQHNARNMGERAVFSYTDPLLGRCFHGDVYCQFGGAVSFQES